MKAPQRGSPNAEVRRESSMRRRRLLDLVRGELVRSRSREAVPRGRRHRKGGTHLDTQEKFTAAMRRLAEGRDLELIVEITYANSGYYSLQPRESFDPVLRFPFEFRTGYSSFVGGVGEPGPLGLRSSGSPWNCVRGGEHDDVLARVVEILTKREEESRSRPRELAGPPQ